VSLPVETDPIREAVMQAAATTDVLPHKLDMAYAVFTNLLFDQPLSPAQVTDFGVDTEQHYRALNDAISAESETTEVPAIVIGLARRLGDGPALTAWVRGYWPDAPVFETAYDGLGDPEQGDPEQYPFDDERRPHP
jgi:hypothetical protein